MSRILTANFFHMAATGLCGLALCRALLYPGWGMNALFVFITVVIVHGIYDTLLSLDEILPAYGDASIFAITIYIYLSLRFFGDLRALREPGRDHLSIKGTLILGMSMLAAVALVFYASQIGLKDAVLGLGFGFFSSFLIACLFVRQLSDS